MNSDDTTIQGSNQQTISWKRNASPSVTPSDDNGSVSGEMRIPVSSSSSQQFPSHSSTGDDEKANTGGEKQEQVHNELHKEELNLSTLSESDERQSKSIQEPSHRAPSPKQDGASEGQHDDLDSLQKEIEELLGKLEEEEGGESGELSPSQKAALASIEERKGEAASSSTQEEIVKEDEETRAEAIEKLKREIQAQVGVKKTNPKGVEHTYYGDLSQAMGKNDPKTMSTLITRARREEKEKKIRSPFSKKNLLYIAGSLILLVGIVFLFTLVFKKKEPVRYIREKTIPSMIYSEKSTGVNLTELTPEEAKQAVRKLLDEKVPEGTIHHIYYVEKEPSGMVIRDGVDKVFDRLKVNAPDSFKDAVYRNFMHGVYGGDKNYPFLLFKLKSYDKAFTAMREWEPHMIDDLGVMLNLPDKAFDRSLLEPGFQNDIIQNKTVRVARYLPRKVDENGEVIEEIYKDKSDSPESRVDTSEGVGNNTSPQNENHSSTLSLIRSLLSPSLAYAQNNSTGVICRKYVKECFNLQGEQVPEPAPGTHDPTIFCTKKIDYSKTYGKEMQGKDGYMCTSSVGNDTYIGNNSEGQYSLCYKATFKCYDDNGVEIISPTVEDINNPRYTCIRKPDYSAPPVGDPLGTLSQDPHYVCYGGKGEIEESKVKHAVGSGQEDETIGDIWDELMLLITRETYVGMQCDPITGFSCQYLDEPSITATQKFLKAAGLMDSASPEGKLDVLTQETLRDFQMINGLNPSGVIDQQTANLIQSIVHGLTGDVTLYGGAGIAAINNYIDGTNVGLSAYNEDVQALQIFLYAEGYPISQINGFFDHNTLEALQQFQQDHNLPVTTGDPGDIKINDQTVQVINGMIQEKNYLGSGFELKDGKLIGFGKLEGKLGPGFVIDKVFADEFKKGDIVLMYTFLDEQTLLITTHESVIKEVIKRLALSDIFNEDSSREKPAS